MIVSWLVFNMLFAGLLGVAALAADHVARQCRWPTRPVWAVALAVATLGPLVAMGGSGMGPGTEFVGRALAEAPAATAAVAAASARIEGLDGWVLAGWVAASAALTLLFVSSLASIVRQRRRWALHQLGDCAVFVSDHTGPAVAGFFRSVIVLPRWALQADSRLRRLMLAHEREHVRAGDPRLLLAASIALLYMPLNPVVWWLVRRLRLAVEVDCDRRVLQRHRADVPLYGQLLLQVGARASGCRLPMPAFSSPATTLEERIRAMTVGTRRLGWLRSGGLMLAAMLITAGATVLPDPAELVCMARAPGWHKAVAPPVPADVAQPCARTNSTRG